MTTKTATNAIATAISNGYESVGKTGEFINSALAMCRKYFKGKDIPDAEIKAIVTRLSELRGWKGASAMTRQSEARNVLKAYQVLPEAITKLRKQAGRCTWHNVITLARGINKLEGSKAARVSQSVMALTKKTKTKKPEQFTKAEAKKSAHAAITRMLKMTKLDAEMRGELTAIIEYYGLAA